MYGSSPMISPTTNGSQWNIFDGPSRASKSMREWINLGWIWAKTPGAMNCRARRRDQLAV